MEAVTEAQRLEPGALVRVRIEPSSSLVLPADQAGGLPNTGPDLLSTFCTEIVLVRTPANDEDGVQRWVEVGDLTLWVEADSPARLEPD